MQLKYFCLRQSSHDDLHPLSGEATFHLLCFARQIHASHIHCKVLTYSHSSSRIAHLLSSMRLMPYHLYPSKRTYISLIPSRELIPFLEMLIISQPARELTSFLEAFISHLPSRSNFLLEMALPSKSSFPLRGASGP